jgi:hypothetical protein
MSSWLVLGPTLAPIQWIPGALSPQIKRPGREADNSTPTSAEFKKTPPYAFMVWCLIKHRDNFTFEKY